MPGFPGEIEETTTLQLIVKHTFQTLNKNNGLSLFEKLHKQMGDAFYDYIHVFSMRNHGIINMKPCTEQVYIHSKLMIIDDEKVLIGSANINDRSMLGSRDSEVGVVIEDTEKTITEMNGKIFRASKFAYTLRLRIWGEILGISNDNINMLDDPLSDDLYYFMISRAKSNTSIYKEIFNVIPDDDVKDFNDIETLKKNSLNEDDYIVIKKYKEFRNDIKGLIVEFPLEFLSNQNLSRSYFCKEILVPLKSFL